MMFRLLLFFILIFPTYAWAYSTGCIPENGGTCYLADATQSDITAAIAAASNGDTIRIAAGTATFTSKLTVTKSLYIIGNGIGSTYLQVGFAGYMLELKSVGLTRLSSMTLSGVASTWDGVVSVNGSNKRIDNINFDFSGGKIAVRVLPENGTEIVIHDCTFGSGTRGLQVYGSTDYWSTPSYFAPGTNRAVYVEDCTFYSGNGEVLDVYMGGGGVFRNNKFINGMNIALHGADSSDRSGGWHEVYNNDADYNGYSWDVVMVYRGGIQFIFNNTITEHGSSEKNKIKLQNWRSCYPAYGAYATPNTSLCQHDGTGNGTEYDQDYDPPANGWSCKDQIGVGPNQVRYGSYEFGNTFNGLLMTFAVAGTCAAETNHIVLGRDMFTASTGISRVTSNPSGSSCSNQYYAVWYDADNDSVYDTGVPSGTPETLYQCQDVGGGILQWASYYTPYTYPHPLRGGSTPTLTIPAGVVTATGNQIQLTASESAYVGTGGSGGFTLSASGGAVTLTYSSGSGTTTLTYTTSRTIYQGETISLSYTQPGDGIEDGDGDDLSSFSSMSLTNNSLITSGFSPTSAVTSTNGNSLSVVFSSAVQIGSGGSGGVTLSASDGSVVPTYSSGSGTTTLVYTLSRTLYFGETIKLDYAQPSGGNGIELVSNGTDASSITDFPVTNSSTVIKPPGLLKGAVTTGGMPTIRATGGMTVVLP